VPPHDPPKPPPLSLESATLGLQLIKVSFVVSGNPDTFDKEAFTSRLADALLIPRASILVSVMAASISLEATILPATFERALQAMAVLDSFVSNPATAVAALGVDVLSTSPPVASIVDTPPPPLDSSVPLSAPLLLNSDGVFVTAQVRILSSLSTVAIVVAILAVVSIALACLIGRRLLYFMTRRRRQLEHQPPVVILSASPEDKHTRPSLRATSSTSNSIVKRNDSTVDDILTISAVGLALDAPACGEVSSIRGGIFNQSLAVDGHHEVSMPWKDGGAGMGQGHAAGDALHHDSFQGSSGLCTIGSTPGTADNV
jgi:hypothetical protein